MLLELKRAFTCRSPISPLGSSFSSLPPSPHLPLVVLFLWHVVFCKPDLATVRSWLFGGLGKQDEAQGIFAQKREVHNQRAMLYINLEGEGRNMKTKAALIGASLLVAIGGISLNGRELWACEAFVTSSFTTVCRNYGYADREGTGAGQMSSLPRDLSHRGDLDDDSYCLGPGWQCGSAVIPRGHSADKDSSSDYSDESEAERTTGGYSH